MRRLIILALLLYGMELILPLGSRGFGAQSLLTFGFLILAAYTVGELVRPARLPLVVGYVVAGVLFGPALLNIVNFSVVLQLEPVSELAVALIAFLAGAELDWVDVRQRGVKILRIMCSELGITFIALIATLYTLRTFVTYLGSLSEPEMFAFSLLFASVAVVHSPAVTMALLTETGARGPVARTTLGVVLLADVMVVLLFSGALGLVRAVVPPEPGAPGVSFFALAWELGGALLVGALLGGAIALYLRFFRKELFLFALLVTFFGAAIAQLVHVEKLLTLLMAGFVTNNVARHGGGEALRHAMERSAAPVIVVFFALAGAKIVVSDIAVLWPVVVPLVAVRAASIWAGTALGARWAGVTAVERRYTWLGLVSQAGVAVGLASVAATAYPEIGPKLRTLLLAVIAVNTAMGAILFRHALVRSQEAAREPAASMAA